MEVRIEMEERVCVCVKKKSVILLLMMVIRI
jgi:hypothetical protein